jgi:hypothetical protein
MSILLLATPESRVQSTTEQGRCCHACPSPTTALPHCPTTCNNFGSTRALTMNKFIIMKKRQFLVYTTPKRLILFCIFQKNSTKIFSVFFCTHTIGEPACNQCQMFGLATWRDLYSPCGLALSNNISTEDKHGHSVELQ